MALQRLKDAAEKAKCELSTTLETDINLPFITADTSGPKHFNIKLTRAKLEQLAADVFDRLIEPCKQALKDSGKEAKDIDEVLLVGGSTRIPKVQEIVKDIFNREAHKGVNPDEVVAMGAAIQAGIITRDVEEVVLTDVTPLSLGIETLGGVFTKLIERNTTIPVTKGEIFSTAADNQTSVEIHVLQGERGLARDNRTLGRFHLVGIPPAPRGVPQIDVTFDIDVNGIVNVSAKDLATNKEQKITITSSSGLSEEDIENMVKDSEKHSKEDIEKKEEIELKNQADQLIYTTEKILNENKDKIPPQEANNIQVALEETKKAVQEGGKEKIQAAINNLTSSSHKLAEIMYQKQAAHQASSAQAEQEQTAESKEEKKTEDEVIDAEYVDMDDKETTH